jgi:hypothetical protein
LAQPRALPQPAVTRAATVHRQSGTPAFNVGGAMLRAQYDLHEALTDLDTIDRHINLMRAEMGRHQRCGQCEHMRKYAETLDMLLTLRLRFMDRRDTAAQER